MATKEKLMVLANQTTCIRNICIVAHVDHGKTSVADCLLVSNGLLATWMTGRIRYMDTRDDEQERGITMKSSSLALCYKDKNGEYLINLIDSPGHLDFNSEVSTAIRICDGAVLVVDVVEGVRSQTITVLRQVLSENLKLVLILNKMDRLVIQLQLTPEEAYDRLARIIETLNSYIVQHLSSKLQVSTDSGDLKEADLLFSPLNNNVIFASALDGWGFTIDQFVVIMSKEYKIDQNTLRSGMWGDFYLSLKTKKVLPNAREKSKMNMCTSVVFQTIWTMITSAMSKDTMMIQKICSKLDKNFDLKLLEGITDVHAVLKSIMQQWFPLDYALFNGIVKTLPNPTQLTYSRITRSLMSSVRDFNSLSDESKALAHDFQKCDPLANVVIAFVSKFIAVTRMC